MYPCTLRCNLHWDLSLFACRWSTMLERVVPMQLRMNAVQNIKKTHKKDERTLRDADAKNDRGFVVYRSVYSQRNSALKVCFDVKLTRES